MPIGLPEIAVILVIVLLIFGGKKLRTLGSDLGEAIRGFRNTMGNEAKSEAETTTATETEEKKTQAAE